jgi:hypothetical protein
MFSFLVTFCFTLVSAQEQQKQLELSQHTALMDLYNALGSNRQTKKRKSSRKNVFALQVVLLNRHRAHASRRLHRALAVV